MSRRGGHNETFLCPVCGTEVRVGAAACPECGSDERTGWSDQTIYDGTDIVDPDEKFDHAEWEQRERGGVTSWPARRVFWWLVAIGVLVVIVFLFFGREFGW